LIEGERGGGKNGGKEAGGSERDKFLFSRDVFFPRVKTGFGDFDLIGVRAEIEGVVGSSGEVAVDKNLSLFRVRRGG